MWICLEIKDQKLKAYGLFCCNNCAIAFAEEHKFREASFHQVQSGECLIEDEVEAGLGDYDA